MLKAFKTEIKPTVSQSAKIRQSIGVCRWLYKMYKRGFIELNKKYFMTANDFDKYINNAVKTKPEFNWINSCGSKARKKAVVNAENAFKKFFYGKAAFPCFKKKNRQDVKLYFPKNNKGDWTIERHRIQIPTLKNIRIKEYGYLPVGSKVINGTVSYKAGRYYVAVIVDILPVENTNSYSEGIGIDLGLKEFAIDSKGEKYQNINKTEKMKKLEKQLKREQRRLSRKYEEKKKRGEKAAAYFANIEKTKQKVQKLHQKIANKRTDYINKTVVEIIKQKPRFISLEDLNIRGMMKNRHLSKAIGKQKFYEFKTRLEMKARLSGIEIRIANRYYPSSKKCSQCGEIKADLKLKDRIYHCEHCGLKIDRDINAAINLKNAEEYKIA